MGPEKSIRARADARSKSLGARWLETVSRRPASRRSTTHRSTQLPLPSGPAGRLRYAAGIWLTVTPCGRLDSSSGDKSYRRLQPSHSPSSRPTRSVLSSADLEVGCVDVQRARNGARYPAEPLSRHAKTPVSETDTLFMLPQRTKGIHLLIPASSTASNARCHRTSYCRGGRLAAPFRSCEGAVDDGHNRGWSNLVSETRRNTFTYAGCQRVTGPETADSVGARRNETKSEQPSRRGPSHKLLGQGHRHGLRNKKRTLLDM